MKFTKENVQNAINKYFWQVVFEPCGDLIAEIRNLDDTPEKVVVPKFVAAIIENAGGASDRFKEYAIRSVIDDYYKSNWEPYVQDWFDTPGNILKFYRAVEHGYVIEGEPLYYIILPFKKVENGDVDRYKSMSIYVAIDKEGAFRLSYNQPHVTWGWKVKFTEAEIKATDERYIPFMVPVDEVNND